MKIWSLGIDASEVYCYTFVGWLCWQKVHQRSRMLSCCPNSGEHRGGKREREHRGDALSCCFHRQDFSGDRSWRGLYTRCWRMGFFSTVRQPICFTCTKMPNYRYVQAENPVFLSDKNLKIEKDIVGRGWKGISCFGQFKGWFSSWSCWFSSALEKHLYMTLL